MDDYEEAVLFTFALLESRLDRIEYALSGTRNLSEEKPKTLPERIQRIERTLSELSEKTSLLDDVQQLLAKHSDLLSQPADVEEEDAGLTQTQKSILVSDRAPAFATTASQLKSLDDQQIPQTDGFVKLAKLRPRIAEAEERQLQQALRISLLRKQSGMLVSRVKHVHLLGQGRCWVEWHKRLTEAERTVVRTEFRNRPDEEAEI
ncbi:hypothetical protein BU24DRAFT_408849 [Aaosphaeria arxii CBS 175.79]|uniref:Nuclear distribution protein RO10 n=1 Tax=Aaosphaeria arxii CBS 175.79 TaxID=1450172 RepID=A0A6A5XRW6_9PLEO|nr:uncharacterized protein BU24DRAFT_408849 [Aaosphaeria arxii CBS 175.79]KAF2015649.1 hypothetical protein BU24DRAFT_408849 [Aaosphaeria arxii CBS 175.79]